MNNRAEQQGPKRSHSAGRDVTRNRLLSKALLDATSAAAGGLRDKSLGVRVNTPGRQSASLSGHALSKTNSAAAGKRVHRMTSKNNSNMIAAAIQRRFGRYPASISRPPCDNANLAAAAIETKEEAVVDLASNEEEVTATALQDTSIPETTSQAVNADEELVQQVDTIVQEAALLVSKPPSRLKIDRSRIRSATVASAGNDKDISVPDPVAQARSDSFTIHVVDGDEMISTPPAATSAAKLESVVPHTTPTKGGTISKQQEDRGSNSAQTNTINDNKLASATKDYAPKSMTNFRKPMSQKVGDEPRASELPVFRKIDGPRSNQTYTAPTPRNMQSRFFTSAQKISRPIAPITKPRVEPWALNLFSHILHLFHLTLPGSVTLISKLTTAFQAERYVQFRKANITAVRAITTSSVPGEDVKSTKNNYTRRAHSESIPIHRDCSLDVKLTKDGMGLLKEFMSLTGSIENEAAVEDVTETIEFQPALPLALAAILGINPVHVLEYWRLTVPKDSRVKMYRKSGSESVQKTLSKVDDISQKQQDRFAHAEQIIDAVARGDLRAADGVDNPGESTKRWARFDRLWGAGDDIEEDDIPAWLPKGAGVASIPERKYLKECIATASTSSILSKSIPSHPVLVPGCTGCNSESGCGTIDGCSCLGLVGGFAYNHDALRDRVVSHVIECGDACGCDSRCTNRCVERWTASDGGGWKFSKLLAGLVVKATRRKGWGLFTTRDINHGSFIGEYVGTILTPQGIAVRTAMNAASASEEKNTSVLVVRERTVFNDETLCRESFGFVANVSL
ncbi:hypothetical protein HDU80_011654 [Chytriomyces hyalinus]|nr:hypothetical protein HDU80_011654 [Chytriomyces hyalinus]